MAGAAGPPRLVLFLQIGGGAMAEDEHGLHEEPRPSAHRKVSAVEREREWLAKLVLQGARGRLGGRPGVERLEPFVLPPDMLL